MKEELDAASRRVMESGWYILGKEVEVFEEEFAAYCDIKFCVGVSNGLEALHLTLRGMNIGLGDNGSRKKYYNDLKGFNSRINELQAAFLRVKLKKLDEWNGRRREVASRYLAELSSFAGIVLPYVPDWAGVAFVRHSAS